MTTHHIKLSTVLEMEPHRGKRDRNIFEMLVGEETGHVQRLIALKSKNPSCI